MYVLTMQVNLYSIQPRVMSSFFILLYTCFYPDHVIVMEDILVMR